MNVSTPKIGTVVVSVVLVALGILFYYVIVDPISPYAIWFIVVGYLALLAGVLVEGM
jgi:hypothetical protein